MKRTLATVLIAALTSVLFSIPAYATRSDEWADLREQFISAFEVADTGNELAHSYAYIMGAIAAGHGWSDPRIPYYLGKVYDLRNADGGWGLNYAYDKFNDGSVNPAATDYTVTITDHVGLVLLDAYQAGLVPAADISTLVALTMTAPTYTFSNGQCVAYSRSGNDNVNGTNGRCVYNVNALAGWWLQKANALGFSYTSLHRRIVYLARTQVATYDATNAWWPYQGAGALQDADHNAATAEAMYSALSYPLGREAAYQIMTHDYDGTPYDSSKEPIAHMRLVGLPGGPGSMSGGTTLWCVLGDNWLAEAQDFADNLPSERNVAGVSTTARAAAQGAYWAARNAAVC